MNSDSPAVQAQGLRRRYGSTRGGGFTAVRGLDLTVARGELFALLGTNGAGKTSTMELIEGWPGPPPAPSRCWATTPTGSGRHCGRGSGSCSRRAASRAT